MLTKELRDKFKKEIKKIINHFGSVNQIVKAIEECSELSVKLAKAIPSYRELTKEQVSSITEEMADVYIMLEQLILIFDNEKEVKKQIEFKKDRTLKRYDIK